MLAFVAAASVLVLEIAAGRLLAPYVGVSLTTYTGIIGAILAGIALGAWLGGKAADAFGPLPLIGPAFMLGGSSAIAAVPIVGAIGGAGLGDGLGAIVRPGDDRVRRHRLPSSRRSRRCSSGER